MIKAGNENYIYGSTAEKLQYDVYEENTVLRKKKVQRSNNKEKIKMILTTVVLFCMCFVVMYRYAIITEMNYNVYKQNQKYNDIKNENSNLKVQIEKELNLNNIKEIAEKELGMQKPDRYQKSYVKVPKYDYTRVAEDYKNGEKSTKDNIFIAVAEKVSQLSSLMY